MAQPTPSPPQPSPGEELFDDRYLRIVLFGLPDAGKSSLLGALGQIAQRQHHLLGGKLAARGTGFLELASYVEGSGPPDPTREIVAHPIRFDPNPGDHTPAADVVLLDCAGKAASELLLNRDWMTSNSPVGTLAYEVTEADALLLLVDASSPPGKLEADFTEFGRFLQAMQLARGDQTEVAGLPVYLVLTRCDLLAQPEDNSTAWLERIEQRKREVDERFRAFLASATGEIDATGQELETSVVEEIEPTEGFGRVDLHIWATAIRWPALVGATTSVEPFGVAELFRQALTSASQYRSRWDTSQQRLRQMVGWTAALVLVLVSLISGMIYVNQPNPLARLQARVDDYRFIDQGTPAERLTASVEELKKNKQRLDDLKAEPLYNELPASTRNFVEDRDNELSQYIAYLQQLVDERTPWFDRSEDGLAAAIEKLNGPLALPNPEWQDTPAGRLRARRIESAQALRQAARRMANWYLEQLDEVSRVRTFANQGPGSINWADWTSRSEELLDTRLVPPYRDRDVIPGSPDPSLTYLAASRIDSVVLAKAEWNNERERLRQFLDLATAVGLARPSRGRPAVLVFPPNLKLEEVKKRLFDLRIAYPDFEQTFVRATVPEEAMPAIRQAARRQYDWLLEPARAEVLRQLKLTPGSEETLTRWEGVRTWLRRPDELASWREMARILNRLIDPSAEDPVVALGNFLSKTQFTIEARTLRVELRQVLGLRPADEARFTISSPGSKPALSFVRSGEPAEDRARSVWVYTYRLSEGQRINYKPGDKLSAELPLRGGKERLVWSQSRSQLYQFEALVNPPRRQSINASSLQDGDLIRDVQLIIQPEDGVPLVPDLLPTVRLRD